MSKELSASRNCIAAKVARDTKINSSAPVVGSQSPVSLPPVSSNLPTGHRTLTTARHCCAKRSPAPLSGGNACKASGTTAHRLLTTERPPTTAYGSPPTDDRNLPTADPPRTKPKTVRLKTEQPAQSSAIRSTSKLLNRGRKPPTPGGKSKTGKRSFAPKGGAKVPWGRSRSEGVSVSAAGLKNVSNNACRRRLRRTLCSAGSRRA